MAEYGPYGVIPTAEELVKKRRNELIHKVRMAEERTGHTLSTWQFEAAVATLTYRDFYSSGRGAGKSFLYDFMDGIYAHEEGFGG